MNALRKSQRLPNKSIHGDACLLEYHQRPYDSIPREYPGGDYASQPAVSTSKRLKYRNNYSEDPGRNLIRSEAGSCI